MPRSQSAAGQPRSIVVIPARYASTRLPRKMLLRETGKTLLQHTYEAACAARKPAGVIVATDHPEIAREVERFHGDFVMTSADCASGTDRVAEVARKMPRAEILVNVQGDEPEMMPENIDRVIELLEQSPTSRHGDARHADSLGGAACESGVRESRVRRRTAGRCISAAARFRSCAIRIRRSRSTIRSLFYQHLGIYAYRRDTLLEVAKMPPSSLEQAEKLEQLRMLQSGGTILVASVEHSASGIDTPADYAAFVARRRAAG